MGQELQQARRVGRPRDFRRFAAPCIVTSAAQGIAVACVSEREARLHALLSDAIDECQALVHPVAEDTRHTWEDACQLTGVAGA